MYLIDQNSKDIYSVFFIKQFWKNIIDSTKNI